MDDSLITVKEVADYLKLKEQTVYLLARQNKIPSLKVGGSLRFKKSQIDAWLASSPKNTTQEGQKPRVLIVDDEEDVELLFRQRFRHDLKAGRFVMEFAQSASAALQRIANVGSASLILILSDINMPGMNGLELLKQIKERYPQLKVYMITAYGDEDSHRRAVEYGCDDYLTKPIDFSVLRNRIGLESATRSDV